MRHTVQAQNSDTKMKRNLDAALLSGPYRCAQSTLNCYPPDSRQGESDNTFLPPISLYPERLLLSRYYDLVGHLN